jgi:hypothetical protein
MRNLIVAALLAAAAAAVSPALAGMPVTQKMTCPIGGKSFDFVTTASYSTFGERPDGKPYGSWTFPMALPECPDNGLVLYKEYDPEEVTKLEPLIASDAYQALRKAGDTQYYRAYWLMKEMGLGPERYLWALLQASWEADSKPALRARYLAELAEASGAVEARPADLNWIGMEGRAINALRELGRFDEALARLDKVPMTALAAAAGGGTDKQAASRKGWSEYFRSLRTVIERKDSSSEPFDMIPRNIALGRCIDEAAKLEAQPRAFCEKESAAVVVLRGRRAAFQKEMDALKRSRDASGR